MGIAVSPKLHEHMPDYPNAAEDIHAVYDVTLVLTAERDELWIKNSHRRFRPFYVASVADAFAMLEKLRK